MTSNPNAAYWSQVCFAAENWRIAENLAEGGYDEIAGVYRGAAEQHMQQAEAIKRGRPGRPPVAMVFDDGEGEAPPDGTG